MEVGDYVRTKEGIEKIKVVEKNFIGDENCIFYATDNKEWNGAYNGKYNGFTNRNRTIIKSSPNIIDLIEYGDIVKYKIDNDEFISEVWGEKNDYFVQNFDVPIDLRDLNIVSVITHEQIKKMEYRIGE